MTYARTLRRAMKPHLQPDRTTLEAINELNDTRQLHPTKGWRPVSVRRSQAQIIMAMVKAHQCPWSSRSMQEFDR